MRKKTAIKAFYRQYKDLCRRALFLLFTLSVFQYMSANISENVDKTKEAKELKQSNVSIKGSIKDQTGEPLGGVSVVIKGTTTGVISDIDGLYSINVPNPNATLVFSFIGFHPQEITVGNKTSIDVVLQEDAKVLDDVVVVGYGTLKRSELQQQLYLLNLTILIKVEQETQCLCLKVKLPDCRLPEQVDLTQIQES